MPILAIAATSFSSCPSTFSPEAIEAPPSKCYAGVAPPVRRSARCSQRDCFQQRTCSAEASRPTHVRIDGAALSNQPDNETADDEVGPDYFSTIGVPIVLGREITQQDFFAAAHVAVVNETFANFYLPGRNPLGHKVFAPRFGAIPSSRLTKSSELLRDVHDHSVRDAVRRRVYAPLTSANFDEPDLLYFEIRAVGNPEMLIEFCPQHDSHCESRSGRRRIETAGALVTDTLSSQVLVAKLSSFFGALVLILVCVGLYGSMAYNVAARTKEIGLRMALGAPRGDLIWMVMREACIVLVDRPRGGNTLGRRRHSCCSERCSSVSANRIRFRLPPPSWLWSLFVSTAAIVPVRRATRVDPMTALRYE